MRTVSSVQRATSRRRPRFAQISWHGSEGRRQVTSIGHRVLAPGPFAGELQQIGGRSHAPGSDHQPNKWVNQTYVVTVAAGEPHRNNAQRGSPATPYEAGIGNHLVNSMSVVEGLFVLPSLMTSGRRDYGVGQQFLVLVVFERLVDV